MTELVKSDTKLMNELTIWGDQSLAEMRDLESLIKKTEHGDRLKILTSALNETVATIARIDALREKIQARTDSIVTVKTSPAVVQYQMRGQEEIVLVLNDPQIKSMEIPFLGEEMDNDTAEEEFVNYTESYSAWKQFRQPAHFLGDVIITLKEQSEKKRFMTAPVMIYKHKCYTTTSFMSESLEEIRQHIAQESFVLYQMSFFDGKYEVRGANL